MYLLLNKGFIIIFYSILCLYCQDDANWKQYAVHAPDVPVQKEGSKPLATRIFWPVFIASLAKYYFIMRVFFVLSGKCFEPSE